MAKIEKQKIEKIVKTEVDSFIVEFTEQEAIVVRHILGCILGHSKNSCRNITNSLYYEMQEAGVPEYSNSFVSGAITFMDDLGFIKGH